jgi:hypothetical protein
MDKETSPNQPLNTKPAEYTGSSPDRSAYNSKLIDVFGKSKEHQLPKPDVFGRRKVSPREVFDAIHNISPQEAQNTGSYRKPHKPHR